MDGRPGAAGVAGDARQQPEALRGAVPAAGRCDPRASERGRAAPCRRDHLARARVGRGRPVEPRLALDLGQQRRSLLPYRPVAQRRGGARTVRRRSPGHGHRLRPLQRLQEARPPSRGPDDPVLLLEPSEARFYRMRGRPGEVDAMVPGMDRADRGTLPPERGAAGALRPRSQGPDAGVRCGARRAQRDARRSLHRGRKAACRAGRRRARGQGAALGC